MILTANTRPHRARTRPTVIPTVARNERSGGISGAVLPAEIPRRHSQARSARDDGTLPVDPGLQQHVVSALAAQVLVPLDIRLGRLALLAVEQERDRHELEHLLL